MLWSVRSLKFFLAGLLTQPCMGQTYNIDARDSVVPYSFSVPVAEGDYDVVVKRSGEGPVTIKAENRRLMVDGKRCSECGFTVHVRDSVIRSGGAGGKGTGEVGGAAAAGTKVRLKPREYAYLHWDDKLTLEFFDKTVRSVTIRPAGRIPRVFLAGNSTVVDQAEEPWAAWGQMIPAFFQAGKVVIANYAESGETLKAFIGERRLAKVWSMARPGDYLFIEFAHNDQKPGGNHLDPWTSYKEELKWYIGEARNRGLIPVLVTSMHRRSFDSSGHVINTLEDYPAAMRSVASESKVALIDLNAMSKILYEAWGPERSIHAFVHYPAGTFPGQKEELKDDTHFNSYGAYELAKCVVVGIKENVPELGRFVVGDFKGFDPARPDRWEDFRMPVSGRVGVRRPDGLGGMVGAAGSGAGAPVGTGSGGAGATRVGQGVVAAGVVGWPVIREQTKPWTRWWWQGSAVDRENLTWNMEKYKAAGLGGLELTPIYGVKGYESHFVDYLSPAWMELFGYTLKEAKRLGLGLDMSTGTGWPFGGGPLIDSTYACKELFSRVWTVKGGGRFTDTIRFVQEPLVHTDGKAVSIGELVEPVFANRDLQALALFQVRFARVLPLQALMAYSASGEVVDLTSKVGGDGRLDWTAPVGGDWTLYGMFQGMHGKMVERAAPGAEGNVIDHFSAVALKKYLSRFDTAFAGHSLSPLRCFFNDSYEVDDARGQGNWTPGFFELFRQRRGYDLRQHLPALFGKGEDAARVLCDYRETISDLLLSEFTRPWGDWAHSKGALIRNQAHGSPANILDLYAASDIPETEGGEILRYKFGTSAAHVMGKPLASAETVTWLDEHFLSGYSDVKKALDNYLLGGVNHIFYHGTAYTPKDDVWPGWLFYAAVHFTPNDPEWKDFGVLNSYVARCQSFLQQGAPDEDVLLYYPVYDSWMEVGAPGGAGGGDMGKGLLKHYDRMDPEFSGTGFKECAELMLNSGYGFDYISDKQILGLRLADGGGVRTMGGGRYRTVLLPDCRYISAAALERLVQLADSGVTILVYKKLPGGVSGLGELERRSGLFKQLVSRTGSFVVGDDLSQLLSRAHVRRESMVDEGLGFVRRTYGDGHVYFIVNHGAKAFDGSVVLAGGDGAAVVYDPMTGVYGVGKGDASSLYLQLRPGQSCVVQTLAKAPGGKGFPYYQAAGNVVPLEGKWKVEFLDGGPELPEPVTVTKLSSWVEMPGIQRFSGTASYSISFVRPATVSGAAGQTTAWLLDLGKVKQTAEVFLNGVKIAGLIGPDYWVVIPTSDMRAQNKLEVRVSSGMLNRIEDMDRRGIVWKKFYNTNFPAHERANRGANGLFDATRLAPAESGLMGPVSLQALMIER